jgi:hypothetical protein
MPQFYHKCPCPPLKSTPLHPKVKVDLSDDDILKLRDLFHKNILQSIFFYIRDALVEQRAFIVYNCHRQFTLKTANILRNELELLGFKVVLYQYGGDDGVTFTFEIYFDQDYTEDNKLAKAVQKPKSFLTKLYDWVTNVF